MLYESFSTGSCLNALECVIYKKIKNKKKNNTYSTNCECVQEELLA